MDAAAGTEDYQKAQRILKDMMRQGVSLSGDERNVCFLNLGMFSNQTKPNGTKGHGFATISSVSGFDFPDDARSVSSIDWDFDGDLDLWVTNRSGPQVRFLRNDYPLNQHHFIAVRLEGVKCNRDAIGSRVQILLANGDKRIETLRAGESFLGQSSKWVHFGLGKSDQPVSVTVYWPDGSQQQWNHLEVDQFHFIRQGADKPQQFKPPIKSHRLVSTSNHETESKSSASILLSSRVPILNLKYQSYEKSEKTIPVKSDKLTLVVVWSKFCVTCKRELVGLSKEKDRLDQWGVDVVALSVNGVGQMMGTKKEALEFLNQIHFPYAKGTATEAFLDKIQFLHRAVFYRPYTLPVPVSFLINKHGEIEAIYRGELDMEKLERHVKISQGDKNVTRPGMFAGRWISESPSLDISTTILEVVKQGWVDDAAGLFERNRKNIKKDRHARIAHTLASKLLETNSKSYEAQTYLEEVIGLDPDHEQAWSNLGAIAYQRGDTRSAEAFYKKAIKIDGTYLVPRTNLCNLLIKTRRYVAAITQLKQLLVLDPKNVDALYKLGSTLAQIRKLDEAKSTLLLVLAKDANHVKAKMALAKVHFLLDEFDKSSKLIDETITSLKITDREQRVLHQLRGMIAKKKH
jgi:tetratricopeptide (TPR) repeat protein